MSISTFEVSANYLGLLCLIMPRAIPNLAEVTLGKGKGERVFG